MDMKLKIAAFLATVLIASGCATQSTNPENSPDTTDPTHSGNLQLYISDQPAAIDSFQYLNVTLSEVRIYAETGMRQTRAVQTVRIARTVPRTTQKATKHLTRQPQST